MTNDDNVRINIGSCSSCGRTLRMKPRGLRQNMHITCKCGHINDIIVDEATLIRHGVIKPHIIEDIYQTSSTPYFRLLDGPRLKTRWAESIAQNTERWKDAPQFRPPVQDIISISMNPYVLKQNAHISMDTIVNRLKQMDKVRPWSVELYENVGRAIRGLLDAPFYIFLGMTEMTGCTSQENYDTFKSIVSGLHSDDHRARSGGEWEIWSQNQGNQWRSDPSAKLLERWVFLDADLVQTFGVQRD
jgi:hypothetical protein